MVVSVKWAFDHLYRWNGGRQSKFSMKRRDSFTLTTTAAISSTFLVVVVVFASGWCRCRCRRGRWSLCCARQRLMRPKWAERRQRIPDQWLIRLPGTSDEHFCVFRKMRTCSVRFTMNYPFYSICTLTILFELFHWDSTSTTTDVQLCDLNLGQYKKMERIV